MKIHIALFFVVGILLFTSCVSRYKGESFSEVIVDQPHIQKSQKVSAKQKAQLKHIARYFDVGIEIHDHDISLVEGMSSPREIDGTYQNAKQCEEALWHAIQNVLENDFANYTRGGGVIY
jgi:hypothetical protein